MISNLKKLFDKENRLFLILVIWLIIGYTLYHFSLPNIGRGLFIPLLGTCIVLFIAALIFRIDLKHLSLKQIILYIIIAVLVTFLIFLRLMGGFLFQIFFILGVVSYVVIIAVFLMHSSYQYGVEWDEKDHKNSTRWIIFLGGTFIAIVLMLSISRLGIALQNTEIIFAFEVIAIILTVIVIFLAILAGLQAIKRKQANATLGIFFIFVAIYTLYLMLNVYFTFSSSDNVYGPLMQIALYIFELFLILYTIAKLTGERAEIIGEKLKYIKSDAILVFLIFSKAAYEYGSTETTGLDASAFGAIFGFILFIPLLFITGIYGIISHSKKTNTNTNTNTNNNG